MALVAYYCKKLTFNNENAFNNPPILIKIPKKGQNKKIDLPVVGFNTVKKCVDARIGSIVVSSKGTVILDLKKIFLGQFYLKKIHL